MRKVMPLQPRKCLTLPAGVVETSKRYWVGNTYHEHELAVSECHKIGPKGTFRLARISERSQLVNAQSAIKIAHGSTARVHEYWTALSFSPGRVQWQWDEKETAPIPDRNLTLSNKEEIKITEKVCFYVTDQAKLNRSSCGIRRKFLCEKVPGLGKDELNLGGSGGRRAGAYESKTQLKTTLVTCGYCFTCFW